jgi:hypothetical protein
MEKITRKTLLYKTNVEYGDYCVNYSRLKRRELPVSSYDGYIRYYGYPPEHTPQALIRAIPALFLILQEID